MTILGIGIDIVEIARIEIAISNWGDNLIKRILSQKEQSIWNLNPQPVRFLAKRFSAKEAAAKALGTGMQNGLTFNQFEIFNDKWGKPYLHLIGKAKNLAKKLKVTHIHVTLSDERHFACSTVIIEG